MRKRIIIAIFIALALTIAATAMWSAATSERDGDPDANVLEDSGSAAGADTETKKGSKVARVLTAPFKAIGKLFGHKDHKLERTTDKDAEKFESASVTRFDNNGSAEQQRVISGTAKEHLAAGRSLLQSGRINESIAELSTAASLDPKLAAAYSLLGVAFDQKGLHDRAKESYERAVRAEPADAQSLNNIGFSLYQAGNYRAAIDRLKRAAKLAPTDERILNNLALALCRVGKFEDAYKNFARAGGELTGRLNTATMLERFGRDDEAIKYYEAARRLDPNNSIAAKRLADLYQRTGKPAQASPNTVMHGSSGGTAIAEK